MASAAFNLTGVGNQDGTTITMASGEKVRVRFTSTTGTPNVFLQIVGNATTTYVTIDDMSAWVSAAMLSGDVVRVRMRGNSPTDNVTGIIESGA